MSVAPPTADILARTHGSGNWGEQGTSAYYTITSGIPAALLSMAETSTGLKPPLRRDLDIGVGGVAFVIDGVLTPDEADALNACSEAIFAFNGDSRMAPGIQTPPGMRRNMAAHYFLTPTPADAKGLSFDPEVHFFEPLYKRFKHLLPDQVAGRPIFDKLNQKMACFKYDGALKDRFEPHHDGTFPGHGVSDDGAGVLRWDGVDSGLSMLLYLNDGGYYPFPAPNEAEPLVGGETRLFKMGTAPRDGQFVDVHPTKGSALFFRHGSGRDSVLHAGLPVEEGTKSVIKMNVLYGQQTGATRVN